MNISPTKTGFCTSSNHATNNRHARRLEWTVENRIIVREKQVLSWALCPSHWAKCPLHGHLALLPKEGAELNNKIPTLHSKTVCHLSVYNNRLMFLLAMPSTVFLLRVFTQITNVSIISTLFMIPFFTHNALHPILFRRVNEEFTAVDAAKLSTLFVNFSSLWRPWQ